METDIVDKVKRDFGSKYQAVINLFQSDFFLENPRLIRSIIYLANKNREMLKHYIVLAHRDCRDVFWQAEYDNGEIQLRNFKNTF